MRSKLTLVWGPMLAWKGYSAGRARIREVESGLAPRSCARPVLRRGHGPGVAEVALAAGLRGPKQETVNTRGQHGGQHGAAGLGLGRAQHL